MASVSSLDQDMRQLRLGRYTPAAANEARAWIEETLGASLSSTDLLQALKDGVALCQLANLALPPPGIKFKKSAMPFIQMENISQFLKACEMSPINLPAHDRFLTVDLFEAKDPAQVLQCIGAFSRQAHAVRPDIFKTTIGPKKAATPASTSTGASRGFSTPPNGASNYRSPSTLSPSSHSAAVPSNRAMSPALTGGSQSSHSTEKSSGPVSSWSKKTDERSTAPAWNIHQYGYMGGANQGTQGVAFGARRQITTAAPHVPSVQEKERARKLKAEEEARAQQQAAHEEQERRAKAQQEEQEAKEQEERRWEEETQRLREEERQKIDRQKREWEEDERRWREEEAARKKNDEQLERQLSQRSPGKPKAIDNGVLRGQTLSQYQRELPVPAHGHDPKESPEHARVRELERQLEEARERERQYQAEREERLRRGSTISGSRPGTSQSIAERPTSSGQSDVSWAGDERDYLRKAWQSNRDAAPQKMVQPPAKPAVASRPLPIPQDTEDGTPSELPSHTFHQPSITTTETRSQLPDAQRDEVEPTAFTSPGRASNHQSRTETFLQANPASPPSAPRISASHEAGDTALEQATDRDRRIASQTQTKAGGWASKSLLEREMEKERERQREWEENQKALKNAPRDHTQGTGEGQSWDVNQYGFVGGDSQNKGSGVGSGINFGGKRQIIGPRAPR